MQLSPNLDTKAADGLCAALLAARGGPIEIDASAVERMGALCLQVLLAAKAQFSADGHAFHFKAPSPAFVETLRLAGCEQLCSEGLSA